MQNNSSEQADVSVTRLYPRPERTRFYARLDNLICETICLLYRKPSSRDLESIIRMLEKALDELTLHRR